MTKSQNVKDEQQKDLCITNEQLTEQWKKGELPEGVYYCDTGYTVETLFTWGKNYHQLTNNKDEVYIPEMDDCEVLAPIPSYDELQNMNEAVNECMAANIKLVEQNKQLKEQINHLLKTQARQFVDNQKLQVKAEKAKDVVNIDMARQIKQLKKLLKECKPYIGLYTENNKHIGFTPETANLLQQINEVLNEKV